MSDEIYSCIHNPRFPFTNLRYLCHPIIERSWSLRGRNKVTSAWPFKTQYVREFSVFKRRCLWSICRIWSFMSNSEVKCKLLSPRISSLEEALNVKDYVGWDVF